MSRQIQGSGLARLQVVLAALLFSTGGAAVKSLSFDAWQVAFLRSVLAVPALLLLLPEVRRGLSWRPSWQSSWRIVPVALAYAATMILYVLANKLTSAANAIFLQYTAPLYVLLLSPFLLKERMERRDGIFMAVLALGMGAFFVGSEGATATATDPVRGNLLAVVTGLTWGLTLLGLRWLEGDQGAEPATGLGAPVLAGEQGRKPAGAATAVLLGNGLAAALAAAFALPLGQPTLGQPTAQDWLGVGYLGVIQIALAYVFLTRAMGQIRALEVSLLLLLELLFNPLLAWMVHGEVPGPWSFVGCGLILGATLVWTWAARGKRAPA